MLQNVQRSFRPTGEVTWTKFPKSWFVTSMRSIKAKAINHFRWITEKQVLAAGQSKKLNILRFNLINCEVAKSLEQGLIRFTKAKWFTGSTLISHQRSFILITVPPSMIRKTLHNNRETFILKRLIASIDNWDLLIWYSQCDRLLSVCCYYIYKLAWAYRSKADVCRPISLRLMLLLIYLYYIVY